MRCAFDDRELSRRAHTPNRRAVELKRHRVSPADDEKRRCPDPRKVIAREVGTTAAAAPVLAPKYPSGSAARPAADG